MGKLLDVKGTRLTELSDGDYQKIESISKKSVAIIGMSGRFAQAGDLSEFWELLEKGTDCIRELPEGRRPDVEQYLRIMGGMSEDVRYRKAAYMEEIDRFDCKFFNISPNEAKLMDPNQRLFLQTAFCALEDAGYGGESLSGTNTGVFVGHSNDSVINYRNMIKYLNPESLDNSIPGNIKSIIASRISYIMDFKGPSVIVDTACSSSLVAVHLACQSIIKGECGTAIAGGIKIVLCPTQRDSNGIGIASSDGRAKTFDESSDGTGLGECTGAVILKAFHKAVDDGDNIYAVILGSAFNQDGISVGITAPNSAAQEAVIQAAWKNAGIDPGSITYIEAHGTGTKLGDPIEINGMERAFKKYTAKKQFCAVGSVKTNVGHMDHAAGITGLIKAVLALQHKKIPPSIHFKSPNKKISFINSPVYVNDRLADWESAGFPRRCGVSSFGLSGTNCHLVLEEVPQRVQKPSRLDGTAPEVLTLSAKTREALFQIIKAYVRLLEKEDGLRLEDICYTANTGRGHYNLRLALVVKSLGDVRDKLKRILEAGGIERISQEEGVYYKEHRVITGVKEGRRQGEVTEAEKRQLGAEAAQKLKDLSAGTEKDLAGRLKELCRLYVESADIRWSDLYSGQKRSRVSLPVYPLSGERCWLETTVRMPQGSSQGIEFAMPGYIRSFSHPLFDGFYIESPDREIYSTGFSAERHWVVREHKVVGSYVVPGTTYLEMALAIGKKHFKDGGVELKDVIFLAPLVVNGEETREIQTVVKLEEGLLDFAIVSRPEAEGSWVRHVQGRILHCARPAGLQRDIESIKPGLMDLGEIEGGGASSGPVETGPRWRNLKRIYLGENKGLACFELPQEFHGDLKEYGIHPSLMDRAMNLGIRSIGEGLYLPFSYGSLKMYDRMPEKLFSYIVRKDSAKENKETALFDVVLTDGSGRVFCEVLDYTIKRVHDREIRYGSFSGKNTFYEMGFIKKPLHKKSTAAGRGAVLLLKDSGGVSEALAECIRDRYSEVYEVEAGEAYAKAGSSRYTVRGIREDYDRLLGEVKGKGLVQVIHLMSLCGEEAAELCSLEAEKEKGVLSLFHLVQALAANRYHEKLEIILISQNAYEVTKREGSVNPLGAALFGLGKSVGAEHPNLLVRCIDIDAQTSAEEIASELLAEDDAYMALYREGSRYAEELKRMELNEVPEADLPMPDEGVCLITGGTGGIGLEMGKYFAARGIADICLVSRSGMPEREKWDEILAKGEDRKLCGRIQAVREMEGLGASVIFGNADVSKMDEMEPLIHGLRRQYGRINGVVHGAGIAGDGFILRKDKAVFEKVLAPKIQGTWILDRLTREDRPGFFILFSSISSLLGGAGQGDYAAANSYLDSFAAFRGRKSGRTLTLNWAAWRDTGMAVDYGVNEVRGVFNPISTMAAMEAFDRVIRKDISRAVIAEPNLDMSPDKLNQPLPFKLSDEIVRAVERRRRRHDGGQSAGQDESLAEVALSGRDNGDYSDTERQLAGVWAQVLGLKELDLYDSFFDVGGDSILALKIVNGISRRLHKSISMSDLFECLTVRELARYLDGRSEEKAAAHSAAETEMASDHEYDLSHAQKRIWFLHKYDPGMTIYNLPLTSFVSMELDIAALNRSINALICRHSSLRTVFREKNGIPRQLVLSKLEIEAELVDLSGEANREELFRQAIRRKSMIPFDLSAPLLAVTAYRLEAGSWCIYLNIHHIITDGWSMGLFYEELMNTYYAYATGQEVDITPLRPGYAEIVQKQKESENGEDFRRMEEYWLSELAKPLPALNLPVDFTRPAIQTYNGSFVKFSIGRERTERLKEISRQLNSTLNMTLLSQYFILLNKISGDDDILVGLPITGRDSRELEGIIGLFVNTICIRADFSAADSFKKLVEQIKGKSLSAYRNGKYPFELCVSKTNPERDLSRSPLISTMFQFYDRIPPENDGVSMFELSLLSRETDGIVEVRIEYNSDIFKRETVERFKKYFLNILDQVGQNPDLRLEDIDIVTGEERDRIQAAVKIREEYLTDKTVHELFREQAQRTPDSLALLFEGSGMTYGELDEKSDRLASLLRREGMETGEPVGIMAERGMEAIWGILGILKAGGAYIPIDPGYPEARVGYMLRHSEAKILLTGGDRREKVKALLESGCALEIVIDLTGGMGEAVAGISRICGNEDILSQPSGSLPRFASSANLMYIIYTSGSTGLPKGVMVTHANAVNYLRWSIDDGGLGAGDRMMLVTSVSFDISVFEIFGALLSGASLVVVPEGKLRDTAGLLDCLTEQRVSIWHSVPALMAQLLTVMDSRNAGNALNFRRIMIGGEAWSVELAKAVRAHFREAEIINMYGPTEATIWVCSYKIGEELDRLTVLPIGKPIANNRVMILDKSMKLCGTGIPGDIYIAGANVTNGYYRDAEKTAEVFRPFGERGEILYKTGDVGRYLDNGNIEYLHRKDGMVKIRGFRIEVGEIENVLLKKEGIDEAAVVTRRIGDTISLVCFYASRNGGTADEISGYLGLKLPEYMVPGMYVRMERLPATPNGKIDRKALAAIAAEYRPEPEAQDGGPVSEIERTLAEIWEELLETGQVGIHSSFFSLGGNSFLVTRMHSAIEEKYPGRVSIIDIFNYPTIERLAAFITGQEEAGQPAAALAEQPERDAELDEIMGLIDEIEKGNLDINDVVQKVRGEIDNE